MKTCDVLVNWVILEEKTRGFRVKLGILEEKMRDFRLNVGFAKTLIFGINGGFAKRKRVMYALMGDLRRP